MEKIIVKKTENGWFAFDSVEHLQPTMDGVVVQVHAFSLNPGEVKNALNEQEGFTPGWDFSGIVIHSSQDGQGPKPGDKVVGILPTGGSWQEQILVSRKHIAVIPRTLDLIQATTLPIPALTALYAVQKGHSLLNKTVLITGSTGAVGTFAHQLVNLSGGKHYGVVRDLSKREQIEKLGALSVYSEEELRAGSMNEFDLIIDSLGGDYINDLFPKLKSGGSLISVGNAHSDTVTFDYSALLFKNNIKFERFFLGIEMNSRDIAADMGYLATLLAESKIEVTVAHAAHWSTINQVIKRVLSGEQKGKVVLTTQN